MALTPQIKSAIDSLDTVDKTLVMLYIFGVDDTNLAAVIGEAFIRKYYGWIADPSNDQMALAVLLETRLFVKKQYVEYTGHQAGRASQLAATQAAENTVQYGNIGELNGIQQ